MGITFQNMRVIKTFLLCFCILLSVNQVKAQEITDKSNDSNDNIKNVSVLQPLRQSITIIKNESTITNTRYTIVPGDVISFSIYNEPDLTQPGITVRPDGYATIVPIGEVYAAGHDINALTKIVAEKLNPFIKDPQISISIMDLHPASIFVYGAVQKPGMYQQALRGITSSSAQVIKTDLNISNVIGNAGGITYDADLTHILVTSESGEKREVNLWKLLSEGDVSQNIILKHGDKVFVPKTENTIQNDEEFKTVAISSIFPETFTIRVIGEVNKPGIYELPSKSPYINSAIASASGYTIDARKRVIQIYRKTPKGNISKINVDPNKIDFMLRPNDMVYVKEKGFVGTVRVCDYLSRIIAPFANIGNGGNGWATLIDPRRMYYY